MKVIAYLSDGGTLEIENFDAETALDLRGSLDEEGPPFLAFEMDEGTVIVNRAHIVRIDFDGEGSE